MPASDLGRRLGVAVVGVPFGIGIIYLGGWFLGGVIAVLAGIGVGEVYRLAEARGWRPFRALGVPAGGLLVLAALWTDGVQGWAGWSSVVLLGITLGGLTAAIFLRGPGGGPLPAVATTLFGVGYVGMTLAFAMHLRAFPGVSDGGIGWEGSFLLILPLVVTWSGDTGAYFVGRSWGRRKLLPAVSPAKTMEGAMGGLVGSLLGATLFAFAFLPPGEGAGLPLAFAALLGLVVGGMAQVGDLAESLLKREAGVKDSGTILPGHGGVLDRFDSVFFALPVTYALLPLLLR